MLLDPELRKLKFEGYCDRYIAGERLMTDAVFLGLLKSLGFTNSSAEAELSFVKDIKNRRMIGKTA